MSMCVSSAIPIENRYQSNNINSVSTHSPTEPLPAELCVADSFIPATRSQSEPITRMKAIAVADEVSRFFLDNVQKKLGMHRSAVSTSFRFHIPAQILPLSPQKKSVPVATFSNANALKKEISIAQKNAPVSALYEKYPHLETMDLHAKERIDQELSPLRGAVDAAFIKKMVEQHKMSEKEAEVTFHCRKWAQLNGFSLNSLD